MNDAELERILALLLADEPPPSVIAAAEALFALRSDTDELGDLVEQTDDAPIRVLAFAADTQTVAIAVDTGSGLAWGQLVPRRSATIHLVSVAGPIASAPANADGRFELPEVPPGAIQLVVEPEDSGRRPTMRTAWTTYIDADLDRGRPLEAGTDDLLRRRLAARAADAAEVNDRERRRRVISPDVTPAGRFDPPVAAVARTLAPAAQHAARPLPSHRWIADDDVLVVSLEETRDGRLTMTVAGAPELPDDVLVAVDWSTASVEGTTVAEQMVTPLPIEVSERRRSTYDVGSALDLRSFGLSGVRIVPATLLAPDVVEQSLDRGPYGNAIRAWDELTARLGDRGLRDAVERRL